MKRILIKTIFIAVVLLTGMCPVSLSGQVDQKKHELVAKSDEFNRRYPQEKLYLHLDRSSYVAGEDIWFKAYLKNMGQPTANLYVELINAKGRTVYRCNSWAQQGLAYGDIHLGDTIPSGVYQVRAYTNWMRNFDETWFFRKDLVIWNQNEIASETPSPEVKIRSVDLSFMPEGGTFLAGVKNRLAFKANDRNGKGMDVSGKIVDENGRVVTTFKSAFKGMGSFEMTPEAGKTYSALATVAGDIPVKVGLPVALSSGVALRAFTGDSTTIRLDVSSKGTEGPQRFWVIGRAEGKVCCEEEVMLKSGTGSVRLNKSQFPSGIVCFTLLDADFLPCCERLVFVNHHDQVGLIIDPVNTGWRPRGRVVFDLYAKNADGTPAMANLSITAFHVDAAYETAQYPENIMSRFLLSSELKGRIEEPAFYFRNDSAVTLQALDNLLLTHGYRYFDWKAIIGGQKPAITFQPESSVELKGKVYSGLLKRPVVNGDVTMVTVKSSLKVKQQKTDSTGRFRFAGLYFNDTILVAIQSLGKKEKRNTLVSLDKSSHTPPKTAILPSFYKYGADYPRQIVTYINDYNDSFYRRRWHLNDTIPLRGVNVVSKLKSKDDGHFRPYLDAYDVVDLAGFSEPYENILDAAYYESGSVRAFCDAGASFFLNGVLTDKKTLESMPTNVFDKVEMVETAPVPGSGIGPGIFFYTKRGFNQYDLLEKNIKGTYEPSDFFPGMTATSLAGYAVIRKFYSPSYDKLKELPKNKTDYRNTLFWNPILKTDEDGETWFEFYNSDEVGDVKVVVEGMTKDGKLCHGEYKYSVTY